MSDAKFPTELSMDEILASIRRILAEDAPPVAPPTAISGETAEGAAGADDDVLESTEAIDDASVRQLTPTIAPSSPAVDAQRGAPAPPQSAAPGTPLVSEAASLTAAAAFARLAAMPRGPRPEREPPMVGDRTLENVVHDLLRPLLQTWLDANLPQIVERLVAAEIARIAGRPGPP